MISTIKISCMTCRKAKLIRNLTDRYICKYRESSFDPIVDDKPCKEWLPSKTDIELILIRSERKGG